MKSFNQCTHQHWKQGAYSFWKSGKIERHFSSQGKVREFGIFPKNKEKIREF